MTGAELRDPPAGSRVALMCGIAGSGKTTYAQRFERDGYIRLSIDEEVWRRVGRYGLDYEPAAYQAHAQDAEDHLRQRLLTPIAAGRDVVIDFAFWSRSDRDRYKRLRRTPAYLDPDISGPNQTSSGADWTCGPAATTPTPPSPSPRDCSTPTLPPSKNPWTKANTSSQSLPTPEPLSHRRVGMSGHGR